MGNPKNIAQYSGMNRQFKKILHLKQKFLVNFVTSSIPSGYSRPIRRSLRASVHGSESCSPAEALQGSGAQLEASQDQRKGRRPRDRSTPSWPLGSDPKTI